MKTFHTLLFVFLAVGLSYGQFETVAGGLNAPFGLTINETGDLLFTELGTGNEDGTLTQLNADGSTTVIVDGLPSLFLVDLEELAGSWRSYLTSNQLIIVTGENAGSVPSSLIFFDRDQLGGSSPLSLSDATKTISIGDFVVNDGIWEASNPFSVAANADGDLFVADAAANAIIKVDGTTDALSLFLSFPDIMNPTPIGPPFINVVPTKIPS